MRSAFPSLSSSSCSSSCTSQAHGCFPISTFVTPSSFLCLPPACSSHHPGAQVNVVSKAGAVYVLDLSDAKATSMRRITATKPTKDAKLGKQLHVYGTMLVLGVPQETVTRLFLPSPRLLACHVRNDTYHAIHDTYHATSTQHGMPDRGRRYSNIKCKGTYCDGK